MSYRQRQQRSRLTSVSPPFLFFLVVLCFDRPLLSSLCLLMSTVEPTAEGTAQPKSSYLVAVFLSAALGLHAMPRGPSVCWDTS